MLQSLTNHKRRWFHKVIDKLMPNNCRANLEKALIENNTARVEMVNYINKHEHQIIATLKNDRRKQERTHDRISLAHHRP